MPEFIDNLENSRFSVASIIGAAFGVLLVLSAIALGTSHWLAFFSIEGLMIVVGGSLAVAFMSFQANDVTLALRSIGYMFQKADYTHENLPEEMAKVISWARVVKEKGLRGLEDATANEATSDPFVRYGLDMVVSAYEADEVRAMMETAASAYYERDTIPAQVLTAMASNAPAFGMVGTLVGMVIMLGNFGTDMSGVGAGLAVSLLATLYGVLTARMLYLPAASKLMQKQDNQRFRNYLIAEGMAMLVANRSPRYIQDRLNSYLRPEMQYTLDDFRPAPPLKPPMAAASPSARRASRR